MPIKTWDTKADFDAAYNIGLEPGGHPNTRPEHRGHYERRALFNAAVPYLDSVTPEWSRIVAHFGWAKETSILVVGCGFGWCLEYLRNQGFARTWGVEPSRWIQSAKNEVDVNGLERSLVPDALHTHDLSVASQRDDCREHTIGLRSMFDVVVTERILTSLTDDEVTALCSDLATMLSDSGQLVHIESMRSGIQDKSMIWRSRKELETLCAGDVIVGSGGRF